MRNVSGAALKPHKLTFPEPPPVSLAGSRASSAGPTTTSAADYSLGMSKIARTLVSKKKRRYQQDGFDLDLTYITDRLIAMGIPSEGMEGQFRNPMSEVIRFFDTKHPNAAKVCNLCIEDTRQYDPDLFSGQVASFPFADHNCPPLALIPGFCTSATAWLSSGDDHVVAVHCKAGKSRTGVMICALLLHLGADSGLDPSLYQDPGECIEFYGNKRCRDGKGVTIPSQHRYIYYYKIIVDIGMVMPQPRKMQLLRVRLIDVPQRFFANADGQGIQVSVMDHGGYKIEKGKWEGNIYESDSDEGKAGMKGSLFATIAGEDRMVQCLTFNVERDVTEDIRLQFYEQSGEKKHKLFYLWLHTSYLSEPSTDNHEVTLVVGREQLDKFGAKKKFPKSFKVEMVFQDENPSGRLAECTDEGEKRFRAEKERLLADCLARHPMGSKAASFAGVEAKNLLSDGVEEVDEDEEETVWLKALEVVPAGWKAAAARLKSTGLRFMDESLAAVQSRPFAGGKEWGSYTIGATTITAMQMSAEHCEVEAIGNGLTITARGITGAFAPFEWTLKRVKVPRTEDAGKATAAFRDLAVNVMFDVDLESDDSSAGELVLGEADVQVRLENIDFVVSESGKNKRFVNMFAATFKDALRQQVEEAMVAALSDLTELRTNIDRTLQELNNLIVATPQWQRSADEETVVSAAQAQPSDAAADAEPEPEQMPSCEPQVEQQESGSAEEGIPPETVATVSTAEPATAVEQELASQQPEPKDESPEAADKSQPAGNPAVSEPQPGPNDDSEVATEHVAVGTEVDDQVAI